LFDSLASPLWVRGKLPQDAKSPELAKQAVTIHFLILIILGYKSIEFLPDWQV
jgi:hypothetical protein